MNNLKFSVLQKAALQECSLHPAPTDRQGGVLLCSPKNIILLFL